MARARTAVTDSAATPPNMTWIARLGNAIRQALGLGIACLATWSLALWINGALLGESDTGRALGAMWAVLSTIVAHAAAERAGAAGKERLAATVLSAVLCLLYLLMSPARGVGVGVGMATVVAIGAMILTLLARPDLIATASITSTVVFVVAGLGAAHLAWIQPLLRLLDTACGTAIGISTAMVMQALVGVAGRLDGVR